MSAMTPLQTPRTIPEYLEQLRAALAGADPALVQDALYDAEEYLRAELAEHPGTDEATMLATVATSYGAPDEVADIYRVQETTVTKAMRSPPPARRKSWLGRFFGVALDPHTYGSLFYMLLALPLGILYFTWAVTGVSLSAGLLILIIGVPFIVLFIGTVYALSLVEGRLVETLLGERMPRRPHVPARQGGFLERVKEIVAEPRTWSTLLYMVLMLPLGIAYFAAIVTLLSLSFGFTFGGVVTVLWQLGFVWIDGAYIQPDWLEPFAFLLVPLGIALFFGTLHLARGIGRLHGTLAKHMLVRG
jgi:uncharacterized membrane protein